jgi:hypothetical protein
MDDSPMRSSSILIALLLLLLPSLAAAQHQNDVWYFGGSSGLDFRVSPPDTIVGSALFTDEGCASIADRATGKILFYTDGRTVYNRENRSINDGNYLKGNYSTTQSALIVPVPGSSTRYYIFTADARATLRAPHDGLNYSIIDMALDSGRGALTTINTQLGLETTEKLCAVKTCSGPDFWVLAHAMRSNAFYAFRVSPSGIAPSVTSFTGALHVGDFNDAGGYMVTSPDGRHIGLALSGSGLVQLLDFDELTGVISNPVSIVSAPYPRPSYGICFSPDNTKLYVSEGLYSKDPPDAFRLYQYDITSHDSATIAASATRVAERREDGWGALQIGPDGRIYCSEFNETHIDIIDAPDAAGAACRFRAQAIDLGRYHRSYHGLPNLIVSDAYLAAPTVGSDTAICEGEIARLHASGGASYRWSPAAGLSCASCPDPIASPTATTTYHVEITTRGGCVALADSMTVAVHPIPRVEAGPDTTICRGGSVALHASGASGGVAWTPTAGLSCAECADPSASPTTTTLYTITATSPAGCRSTDSVLVTVLPSPAADAGPDAAICAGEAARLKASEGAAWEWSPADGLSCASCRDPLATPATTTTYHVAITSTGGCSSLDSVTITVRPRPLVSAGPDVEICAGSSATLHATGAASYRWSPAEGLSCIDCPDPVARPAQPTIYVVTGLTADGCAGSDSVTVTTTDILTVDAGPAVTICAGMTTTLTASGGKAWRWSPEVGLSCAECASPSAAPAVTTTYHLTAWNDNGCVGTDSVTVTVVPPPRIDAGPDLTICAGDSAHLVASGAASYRWSPADGLSCVDCSDPIATPATTTSYVVTGAGDGGCSASDTVVVAVHDAATLHASLPRDAHALPGATLRLPIRVNEPALLDELETIEITLGYARHVVLLRTVSEGMAGWTIATLRDTAGTLTLRMTAPPGPRSHHGDTLAMVELGIYLGDTVTSELPLTIELPGMGCVQGIGSAGRVTVDSICGLNLRLIEMSTAKYALKPVVPNPASEMAIIGFGIGLDGPTTLEIFDERGERTALLVDRALAAGTYSIAWPTSAVPTGTYYCRLTSGTWVGTTVLRVAH